MPSRGYHLISDFDGVWTDPDREAVEVNRTVEWELARLSGRSAQEIHQMLERRRREILAEPHRHGWQIDGLLVSYVDEDFFALPSAVGLALASEADEETRAAHAAVRAEFESMGAFMDHCYHSTCKRFRRDNEHDLTRGAEKVLRWLLENEVRVTFVTNAPGEKVLDWFGHHGFEVADAREDPQGDSSLRVYGRAGKQWLGDPERTLEFAGRRICTDRPQYRAILERENPDMILGDVLSLDLAQPIHMRLEGHPAAPEHVVLLYRRETPAWVWEGVGEGPHRIDRRIAHITELPYVVNLARGGRAARAG